MGLIRFAWFIRFLPFSCYQFDAATARMGTLPIINLNKKGGWIANQMGPYSCKIACRLTGSLTYLGVRLERLERSFA